MANPVFPTFSSKVAVDSSQFNVVAEDPAMRSEAEGGYIITRAKHTRVPRRTFGVGYRFLTNSDKLALDSFWNAVKGGSLIFDWTNPQDLVVYAVRFKEPIRLSYTGWGATLRWDCSITVEQA